MSINQFPVKELVGPTIDESTGVRKLDLNGEAREVQHEPIELRQITPEDEDLWHSYGRLRAKTYIDDRQFLSEEHRNSEGEEFDEDDKRATHIVAVKDGQVIGATRLINRSDDEPLPIEEFFDLKLKGPQMEMSRLIIDKEAAGKQSKLAMLSLWRAVMREANRRDIEHVHAVIEEPLRRLITGTGLKVEEVADPRYLEEYHTKNMAIRINAESAVADLAKADREREEKLAPFFSLNAVEHGLGSAAISDFHPDPRRFECNLGLLSKEEQLVLQGAEVAIAGTGGDGGQLAITLANMGVSRFRLADPETFDLENLNRQYGANHYTVGQNKAQVIADEVLKINPWAKIDVYPDGISPENVKEFVSGSNLVFDKTEFSQPELGAMIARAARDTDTPVMMALNVGHGSRVLTFDPRGETFEEWLGLSNDMPIEEIAKAEVPVQRWIGRRPKYANTDVFQQIQNGEREVPSIAPGVLQAAAVAATQAQNLLLSEVTPDREKSVVYAPKMIEVDAMEGVSRVLKKSRTRFARSALRAYVRTKRGKNQPIESPKHRR